MPNWVYDGLTIEGKPESVKALIEQMNQPFVRVHDNWNTTTMQMEKKQQTYPNPVFAFWNIIKPTNLEAYDSQPKHEPDKPLDFSGDDWYNWNVRNWGTKWDVAVSSDDKHPDTTMEDAANGENHVVHYNFNTAWSVPMPAIQTLSDQYPDLLFTLSYQEEQGWGGEAELLRGKIISHSTYDQQCNNCDSTFTDEEISFCDECGDYVCPKCGWASGLCQTHEVEFNSKETSTPTVEVTP